MRFLSRTATLVGESSDQAHHSPTVRSGIWWTEAFPVLFTVGVLTLLVAALTITNPTVAGILLVIGTVCLGIGGVKVWRFAWRVLDLAVGAYLTSREE
jgi:hypothetical protein